MYSKEELSLLIEEYIGNLEFPAQPEGLYEPITYSLEKGGKRIRPLITMMACNIFADEPLDALPCATAVEVFHNFTLLHDDIMDNADVRRGKPSVHRRWGSNAAILSGDTMMIYSYKFLENAAPEKLPHILHIFNKISAEVCEGQQYDMDFENEKFISPDSYIEMIGLKTAALIAGGAAIGAICGGADEEQQNRIYTFAYELGLAFQIKDDLLDSYGTEQVLGKRIGGDILEGKKTFLTVSAFSKADETRRIRLAELLNDKKLNESQKVCEVLEIYDSLGIRKVAEDAVAAHTEKAISALEALNVSNDRIAQMRELALELTGRNF